MLPGPSGPGRVPGDTTTGAVTEEGAQAESGEHLKRLLTEDHRYVFTLIHKFRTDTGETHPKLSDRSDVVVIVDEAHRTQYDTLALNMRNALPNAAFLAFTGTPLMAGEERTLVGNRGDIAAPSRPGRSDRRVRRGAGRRVRSRPPTSGGSDREVGLRSRSTGRSPSGTRDRRCSRCGRR
jgi:hypothetical protein